MVRTFFQRLRTAFLAGILVLTPLAVTSWLIVFLVTFLEGAVHLLPDALQPEQLLGRPIPGLGIALAVSTILGVGFLTRSFIGIRVVELYERILARVPLVSSVYQGVKQLMESVFASDKGHFRQVVMVEYPRRGLWALAFQAGDAFIQGTGGRRLVNIFLPTTPNPTSGFYLIVPDDEVVKLEITIEEAFKLIMSAGIVAPRQHLTLTNDKQVVTAWVEPTEEIPKSEVEAAGL